MSHMVPSRPPAGAQQPPGGAQDEPEGAQPGRNTAAVHTVLCPPSSVVSAVSLAGNGGRDSLGNRFQWPLLIAVLGLLFELTWVGRPARP